MLAAGTSALLQQGSGSAFLDASRSSTPEWASPDVNQNPIKGPSYTKYAPEPTEPDKQRRIHFDVTQIDLTDRRFVRRNYSPVAQNKGEVYSLYCLLNEALNVRVPN